MNLNCYIELMDFHGWNTVDGTHWPIGIYLYEVWDGGQQLANGKVVKG